VVRLDRLENQIRQLTGIIEQLHIATSSSRLSSAACRARRVCRRKARRAFPPSRVRKACRCRSSAGLARGRPAAAATPSSLAESERAGRAADARSVNSAASRHRADAGGQQLVARQSAAGAAAALFRMPGASLLRLAIAARRFDLAYGYVLRKDYALAEDGFRSFLSKSSDRSLPATPPMVR